MKPRCIFRKGGVTVLEGGYAGQRLIYAFPLFHLGNADMRPSGAVVATIEFKLTGLLRPDSDDRMGVYDWVHERPKVQESFSYTTPFGQWVHERHPASTLARAEAFLDEWMRDHAHDPYVRPIFCEHGYDSWQWPDCGCTQESVGWRLDRKAKP